MMPIHNFQNYKIDFHILPHKLKTFFDLHSYLYKLNGFQIFTGMMGLITLIEIFFITL